MGHNHKHFENLKVEKTDGEASVTGEITLEALEEARLEAIKHLNNTLDLPGFRKGNIPEGVLIKSVGEMKVLEETAEIVISHEYGNIMEESKLSPIGRPEIAITKLAPGIPLEFKIKVTLEPEFTLPDYKKIVSEIKKEEKPEASETEVDAVLKEIENRGWKPEIKDGENLRDKIKENILLEKDFRAKEVRRIKIIEEITKVTEIKIPKLLIDSELDRMIAQFKDDVLKQNLVWGEYLKSINKTEDDIRAEWMEKAIARSKAELIMLKIAEKEKLEPSKDDLENEVKHLLSHHKDADPMRVRVYVYQQLKNQKVFEFLETL